jgi:predicted ATPase/transcriptional regulator with XRE-family HTH domain
MDAEVSFGAWVGKRRRLLDLTREQLAQCVGCSLSGLRKIESDERRPSRQIAELLAQCLEIPPAEIPTFVKVARGVERVERLKTAAPLPAPVRSRPTPSPPVVQLPTPLTPMIGRDAELATLARLLRDPQCRLLTLVGPGGIGKTRLALEVACTQSKLFPDGVYFVGLASLTSAQFIVPAMADALGFTFSGPAEPQVQLQHHLRQKCLLLVLDNFEHLLEAGPVLAEIEQQTPGLKLLVTSRERLHLHGEWVFEIEGLPVPPADMTDGVDENSAVARFVQSARRAHRGFVLRGEEQAAVVRICQLVEGMPLGIELAAAWVPVLSCHEIAQEIERGLDFLATSMRDLPQRQRSLRATFEHSWNLLAPNERNVLCRLAVFQGGFAREAAEQVAGATLPVLLALVSKSLIRHKEGGRYDLHEVIRQYALAHLGSDPQHTAVRDRHADYYLAQLGDRETSLKSAGQREAIRELTDEIDNIRVAWAWAIEREKSAALGEAVKSLGWLYEIGGWLRQGIEQLEQLVRALRARPADHEQQRALGETLSLQALLYFRWGRFDQALALLDESLYLLRPLNDPSLLAHPLLYRGVITHLNGELERAQALCSEALACAQVAGDQWAAAYAGFNLGYIASLLGRYDEGYAQMHEYLALWRAVADPRSIALGLNFLSPIAIKLGHYQEAEACLRESLTLCSQVGDRWGMGTAYRYLGLAYLAQGKLAEAESYLNKSLDVFDKFVTGWDIARSLTYLGEARAAAGDWASAECIFRQALDTALEAHSPPLALDALVGLAVLQARAGQAEQALAVALLVSHHPASTAETKERANQLCAELEGRFTPEQVETVRLRQQTTPFETLANSILAE